MSAFDTVVTLLASALVVVLGLCGAMAGRRE